MRWPAALFAVAACTPPPTWSSEVAVVDGALAVLANLDDDDLDGVRDGLDLVAPSGGDEADLTRVLVRGEGAATVRFLNAAAAERLHVWARAGDGTWVPPGPEVTLPVELGLEAAFNRSAAWDGRAVLEVQAKRATLRIPLRVVPIELPSPTGRPVRVAAADFADAFGELPVALADPAKWHGDRWMQDVFQSGWQRLPLLDGGERSVPTLVQMSRRSGAAGLEYFVERVLLGRDVAYASPPFSAQRSTLDYGGNLEVLGSRALVGHAGDRHMAPELLGFLAAQGLEVLELETGWLAVAHVDEVVSVVPADGGFAVLVPSPAEALALLERAPAGEAFSFDARRVGAGAFLADAEQVKRQRAWEARLGAVIAALPASVPVVRLPMLYAADDAGLAVPAIAAAHAGVVVGSRFVTGDPGAPFRDACAVQLRALGLQPRFVDAEALRVAGGSVHCAVEVTYAPH